MFNAFLRREKDAGRWTARVHMGKIQFKAYDVEVLLPLGQSSSIERHYIQRSPSATTTLVQKATSP